MIAVPKFDIKAHIDEVGLVAFDLAVALAMMRLKLEGELIGAPRLREKLAEEMAIVATGGPRRPFKQHGFGRLDQQMQDIIDHYLNTTEVSSGVQ